MYKLKILTPVHIGVSGEKNHSEGLDYIYLNDTIYILDSKKLINTIPPYELANAATKKNGVKKLLESKRIKCEDVSSHIIKAKNLKGREIKAQIRNGFGKPYLPGSSLKGALRSMLVHHYKNDRGGNTLDEDDAFGHIENSILRFLQVYDTHFSKIGIYNSAIMSLKSDDSGFTEGWKKKRTENVYQFTPYGMTTIYESLLPGDQSEVNIDFKSDFYNEFDRNQMPNNFRGLFPDQFHEKLLPMIRSYTKTHLDREKQFVEKYFTQSKEMVLSIFSWLSELNDTDAAVLRVGAGVGFHSITGDWKYKDHTDTGFSSGRKKNKTRKFAFTTTKNDYHLWPMGFVLISKNEESVTYPKHLINEVKKVAPKNTPVSIERRKTEDSKPIEPLENKKFQLGEKVVAIGTGRKKGLNNAVVILYINGYESKEFDFRYAAGFAKGQLIEVEIKGVSKKGVINTVAFSKMINKNIMK